MSNPIARSVRGMLFEKLGDEATIAQYVRAAMCLMPDDALAELVTELLHNLPDDWLAMLAHKVGEAGAIAAVAFQKEMMEDYMNQTPVKRQA
jgi:hypothetical protein